MKLLTFLFLFSSRGVISRLLISPTGGRISLLLPCVRVLASTKTIIIVNRWYLFSKRYLVSWAGSLNHFSGEPDRGDIWTFCIVLFNWRLRTAEESINVWVPATVAGRWNLILPARYTTSTSSRHRRWSWMSTSKI